MKAFNQKKWSQNPFLLFLPFLILYIGIVIAFPTNGTFGDENKYLSLATNLIQGFYSLKPPEVYLGNGPGYPILLLPFQALHLPLICITLLNAFFYYFSIIFLFKAIKIFSKKLALPISIFWAIYLNIYEYIRYIYTEVLTIFLVTLLLLTLIKAFNSETKNFKNKYIYLAGLTLGYLALTKPIFGYVIMCMIIGNLVFILINNTSQYRKSFFILVVALITTIPYLTYTYSVTSKVFYWGSSGGNNLYWMSTPYPNEYGNWIEYPPTQKQNRIPGSKETIRLLHEKDFNKIFKDKGIDQDSIYKAIAFENIKSNPLKFIENCISNIGRMLFNFPYSYELEKPQTLLRLPENGIIALLMLFSLVPTITNWKKLIFPLKFLLFFTILYLGGSILGSAETRMFSMVVPVLLFWIAYIINRTIKIKLKFD